MLVLATQILAQPMGDAAPDDALDGCGGVELVASRTYAPSEWYDAVADVDPITFTIPAILPVTEGGAGDQWASLTFALADGTPVECTYQGGAPVAHPTSPGDAALGLFYLFDACDDGSVAGEQATADHLELRVHQGDPLAGLTEVSVTLADERVDDTAAIVLDRGGVIGQVVIDFSGAGLTTEGGTTGDPALETPPTCSF